MRIFRLHMQAYGNFVLIGSDLIFVFSLQDVLLVNRFRCHFGWCQWVHHDEGPYPYVHLEDAGGSLVPQHGDIQHCVHRCPQVRRQNKQHFVLQFHSPFLLRPFRYLSLVLILFIFNCILLLYPQRYCWQGDACQGGGEGPCRQCVRQAGFPRGQPLL